MAAAHSKLADFDALNREKTLFVLPVGPLEVHGYHLPNDTDMVEAIILAEVTGAMFARKNPDWKVVLLPLLNIGTEELPLPGSIEFSRGTVYRALTEYGRSLARYGFRNLVLTTAHGGMGHNLAFDDACRTCNRRYGMMMTSPAVRVFQDLIFGKKFPLLEAKLGRKLSPAEKQGLTDLEHAGGWETSVMLDTVPGMVDGSYRKCDSSRIHLNDGIIRTARILERIARKIPGSGILLDALGLPLEEGFRIVVTAGKLFDQKKTRYTYSGNPGVARAEIGAAWKKAMAEEIIALIEPVYITNSARASSVVSNYSSIVFLRRGFIRFMMAMVAALVTCAAAIVFIRR